MKRNRGTKQRQQHLDLFDEIRRYSAKVASDAILEAPRLYNEAQTMRSHVEAPVKPPKVLGNSNNDRFGSGDHVDREEVPPPATGQLRLSLQCKMGCTDCKPRRRKAFRVKNGPMPPVIVEPLTVSDGDWELV